MNRLLSDLGKKTISSSVEKSIGPKVSIVIPTRNSQKNLAACLRSLRDQTHVNLDIIVVDNFSSDGTLDVAKNYGCRIAICGPAPPMNDFFTAPLQRRVGGEMIDGDFVFFVDSDMVLPRELVANCLGRCEAGNLDAVIIPEISTGEGFWARCKIRERMCYLGVPGMEAPRFIRATTYQRLGGWVESAGAFDDWAFLGRLLRQGCRISRSDVNLWHAEGRLSLASLFRKKYRMGKTVIAGELTNEGSELMIAQLTPYRFVGLFNRVRLQSNFVEIVGVFLMKIVEGSAIYLGKILE